MENLSKKSPLQDFISILNAVISTNESTQIITGHVIYNPAYTYKFQLKTIIGRFVSLLANFYNKAVNSDAIEDSESMDIIGEFNAMQSRLLTNSSDVFTNLFDEVFPRIFLSVSS